MGGRWKRKRVAAVGAVLGVLVILTGCTPSAPVPTRIVVAPTAPGPTRGGSTPATTTAPTPSSAATSASSTVSGGSAPSEPASAGGAASQDPDRPVGQCADSVLRLSLSMPKGAAGSFDQDLVFTNTGSTPCVLRGAPGLSVVGGGDGTQLGAAATRDQADTEDIPLAAHGGQAYALFGGPELETGTPGQRACAGRVEHGDGYRVHPPHSFRSVLVEDASALACTDGRPFLHVGAVLASGTSR